MSYNTRRSTPAYGQQNMGASSVGQRRGATNNFVPGGQLAGSQQQKHPGTPQQQQRQAQQQPGVNYRNQAQQQTYHTTTTQQYAQQGTPIKQEAKPLAAPAPATPQISQVLPGANPPPPEDVGMDNTSEDGGKKKFWQKGKGNKISKAEKVRRRNLKLSKILQPKNAVMILNELVRGCVYNVEELPVKVDVNHFKGTVAFDGQEFAGTGRTKIGAKNAAAETALKHLVKNKQLTHIKKEEDGDEKMEIGEEDGTQVMPWSHIASFAMYKLFSTWGEDPNLVNKVGAQEIGNNGTTASPREPKPAKKMPDNPETMNPLMLMHQMLPNAVWTEEGKTGNAPNVVFTFSVQVDDKKFNGTASSKKAAKKLAAFRACHEVLNVQYSPEVWSPLN